jgi:hypothetical protein
MLDRRRGSTALSYLFRMIGRPLFNSLIFNRYPIYLYLSMVQEIIASFTVEGSAERFCEVLERGDWGECLAANEFDYLSSHYDLSNVERVVVVGSGAVPQTAIVFAKHLDRPIYCIERNSACYFASVRLLRRLKVGGRIHVIRECGELHSYSGSVVIIALETRLKQDVLERALANNNIIIVRQPVERKTRVCESVDVDKSRCSAIRHKSPLLSVFIDNRRLSERSNGNLAE